MATTAGSVFDSSLGFEYEQNLPTWLLHDKEAVKAEQQNFPKGLLPRFSADTEEQFEERADEVREVVRQYGAHVGHDWLIFQLCLTIPIESAAHANDARANNHDDLSAFLDSFAKKLYPNSDYAHALFAKLFAYGADDLPCLGKTMRARLTRYVRVSKRWGKFFPIPTETFAYFVRKVIPEHTRDVLDAKMPEASLLAYVDAAVARHRRARSEVKVFAAEGDETGAKLPAQRPDAAKAGALPTTPCPRCLKEGHWASKCPSWQQKCPLCAKKGHVEGTCPTMYQRDVTGRPVAAITAKKGATDIKIKHDRSSAEVLNHAKQNLCHLEDLNKAHLEKARLRRKLLRQQKAAAEGLEALAEWERTHKMSDLPSEEKASPSYAAVAAQHSDDDEEDF